MATNRRTIPEIRARLHQIAKQHNLPELTELANEMQRQPAVRRASTRSPKLTKALAQEIRDYAKQHPNMHQQDIAEKFGVNHGRVSEALNRRR